MSRWIWLDAVRPFEIKGREVAAGERIRISRVRAASLIVTGRAAIVRPQPPPKGTVVAAPEPPPQPAPTRRGRPRKADVTTEVKTGIDPVAPADPPPVPEITDVPTAPSAMTITDGEFIGPVTSDSGPIDPGDIPPRRYHRRDLEAEE